MFISFGSKFEIETLVPGPLTRPYFYFIIFFSESGIFLSYVLISIEIDYSDIVVYYNLFLNPANACAHAMFNILLFVVRTG